MFSGVVPELSKLKADYRRTTRDGKNVYAMIDFPEAHITPEEYQSLADKVQGAEEKKPPFYKRGQVISKQEALDFQEPIMVALSEGGGYLDKFLWGACPQLDERPIWSNLTDIEAGAIARVLLKRAQVDPAAASTVRAIVDGADYVTAVVAIGSRGMESAKALRDRPRVERKKKFSMIRTVGEGA